MIPDRVSILACPNQVRAGQEFDLGIGFDADEGGTVSFSLTGNGNTISPPSMTVPKKVNGRADGRFVIQGAAGTVELACVLGGASARCLIQVVP